MTLTDRYIILGNAEELDDSMLPSKKEQQDLSRVENEYARHRNEVGYNTNFDINHMRNILARHCVVDPELERQAEARQQRRLEIMREFAENSSFRVWAQSYVPLEPQEPQVDLTSRSNEDDLEYSGCRNPMDNFHNAWNSIYTGTW